MTSREALLRPFSMWSIEPFQDEPAHGYFARLVAEEEHISSRVYANEIGVNGRDIVPAEQLEVILQLPIPDRWRESLRHATPISSDEGVTIGGEFLRDKQLSIAKRRFCPACLGENAYHRAWWDIVAVCECPFHGLPLQDADPDGRPLKWWWPHIAHTPQGIYLGRTGVPRQHPGGTFEGYVLGRMGFGESCPAHMLKGFPMHDVIDACDMLGRLLGSPKSEGAPPSSSDHPRLGFLALSSGPAHFVESLRDWLRREVPVEMRRRGHDVAFGWFSERRHGLSGHFSELFNTALKKAVAAENRTVPKVLTDADFQEDDIGIEALAQQLGITRRGVAGIASLLGILPEREWYRSRVHFDSEQAALIRDCMADIVTTEEVNQILGLPKFQLKPLVKAGLLDRLAGVSGRNGTGNRYLRSQAERLLADTMGRAPVGKRKGSVSLIVCARHMRVELGKVAALVAMGQVTPCCRMPGRTGFMSLRFLEPAGVTYEERFPTETPQKIKDRIREMALSNPLASCVHISKSLKAEGTPVSGRTVQKHLNRMGLRRKEDRVRAAQG